MTTTSAIASIGLQIRTGAITGSLTGQTLAGPTHASLISSADMTTTSTIARVVLQVNTDAAALGLTGRTSRIK